MKIIIEGEPKEIAAYELALKDGKKFGPLTIIAKEGPDIDGIADKISQAMRKTIQ